MSDPITPFLSLTKPIVGDEPGEDLWGEKLNANFDILDANAETVSDTVGAKIGDAPIDGQIYGRRSAAWEVVVAESVDWSNVTNKPATFPPTLPIPISGVTDLQLALNTLQGGINTNTTAISTLDAEKEDVILPGTTVQFWRGDKQWTPLSSITVDAYTKAQSDARYEPIDTMYTKAESDARYEPFDSAYTKAEDDARFEPKITAGTVSQYWRGDKQWATFPPAVGLVDVGDTPPVSPIDKQLFWESDSGILMLRFNDGNSSQWVQVNNPAGLTKAQADMAYVLKTGDTITGDLTISKASPLLTLNAAAAGQYADITCNVASKQRWAFGKENTAESGANVGSNFFINSYDDAGTYLGTPLSIYRANGGVRLAQQLLVAPGDTTISANVASQYVTINGSNTFAAAGSFVINGGSRPTYAYEWYWANARIMSLSMTGVLTTSGAITSGGQLVGTSVSTTGAGTAGTISAGGYLAASGNSLLRLEQSGSFCTLYMGTANQQFQFDSGFGWRIYTNAALGWSLDGASNMTIAGTVGTKASGTTWSNPSDERIKTDIQDYPVGLDAIAGLRPVTFKFKTETKNADVATHVSLIAQEAEVVMPGIVTTAPGGMGDLQFDDFKSLDASNVLWALVNAVKELKARVEELEAVG